jgi:deazaflavin-dependent oxidoreductase (nitroreductase family)
MPMMIMLAATGERMSPQLSDKFIGVLCIMDVEIERALKTDDLIDITTVGRKTGKPHKIEIAFHNLDGAFYISGLPGRRDWYANLVAHPQFTFHLKKSAQADIPAKAIPITDEAVRRQVLAKITAKWGKQDDIETFVANSPLVQVQLQGK